MSLQKSKFHFVGIGGVGMCGLAEILQGVGATVTGSDIATNANTERLKKLGMTVFIGHHAENVGDVDVLVYSSAIAVDNPELKQARARAIPLIPRAEALAEVMRLKRGIAIAGTHGKTTTTSMVANVFLEAKLSPTIMIGARFATIQSNALLGDGEWMIAEADESDGSFSKLNPEIAIITNIDSDHLDFYKTFENLQTAFWQFANKVPFYGALIVCGDDPVLARMFKDFPKRWFSYGFANHNDFQIRGEPGALSLWRQNNERLCALPVKVPGRHNALNAAAAVLAGMAANLDLTKVEQGIATYQGVDRRFQHRGHYKSIEVYDDYGHHPTEVRATLQAFREKFPNRPLTVLFQPHRYSRTELCWTEFLTCFRDCDELILTDIYAAGEAVIENISSERLASEIKHEKVRFVSKAQLSGELLRWREKQSQDTVFLTLGAGDGYRWGDLVIHGNS